MAGIGIKLNKYFSKNSITTQLAGIGYGTITTVAPMLLVITALIIMQTILKFNDCSYNERQLYQVTILYIFIFSLIASSPLNSVLSRYISDAIFEEKYDEIMPCFYFGLFLNMILNLLLIIPFSLFVFFKSDISVLYILISCICFMSLSILFYTMLYLSLCKDYSKITMFYFIGMILCIILSILFVYILHMSVIYSIIISLTFGFIIASCLGHALLKQYFTEYTPCYKKIFTHMMFYKKLIFANVFYILGLFIHNFIFWTSELQIKVRNVFICAETYDFASCLAMFTNISSSIIFIALVEMYFNDRYKGYSEAVIGGRLLDIQKTNNRMFRLLANNIMTLIRIQFIISTILYLIVYLILQYMGYSGTILLLYPSLCMGYFIVFIMYSEFLYLYYFNDLDGALITGLLFFIITIIGCLISKNYSIIWYGCGLTAGAFVSFTYGYFRLRWLEKNMNVHTFCNGEIIKQEHKPRPSGLVYKKTIN